MITQAGKQFRQNIIILANQLQGEAIDVVGEIIEKRVKQNIAQRVGDEGKTFDGQSFSDYRSKSHIRKRRKKGLQTSRKNFNFSAGMVSSVRLKKKTMWAGGVQFSYGFTGTNSDADRVKSRGKANYKIASYHSANEGVNLMQQSNDEKEEIIREVMLYLEQKIRFKT